MRRNTRSVPSSVGEVESADEGDEAPPAVPLGHRRVADDALLVVRVGAAAELVLQVVGQLSGGDLPGDEAAVHTGVAEEVPRLVVVRAHDVRLVRPDQHEDLNNNASVYKK